MILGKTQDGKDFKLPADAVTQTFALLARRGAGKSNAAVVMAEQFLDQEQFIIAIDPVGTAWWGLKSSADGKHEGYKVLIMGGEHADVPLEPTAGKMVAEFLVRDRVSTILDISLMGEGEMKRFVADFAATFYRLNRDAVHLFVDEADEFAPQSGMTGDAAKSLGAMQNVVRRGRARGIGVTLITQRSAVLNKSVLTQTECLVALQTTGPQDIAAIESWLEHHSDKGHRDEILKTLPGFQQGEAWVYSPGWLRRLARIQIPLRRTFNSSATPKAGERRIVPKTLAQIDIAKLTDRIRQTVEEAKANDPKELKRRIAELEKQAKAAPAAKVETKTVERFILKDAQVSRLEATCEKLAKRLEDAVGVAMRSAGSVQEIQRSTAAQLAELSAAIRAGCAKTGEKFPEKFPSKSPAKPSGPAVSPPRTTSFSRDSSGALPKGERIVLTAVAQYPKGATREQLTVLTGYKRSSRDTYLQRLRERGYVDGNDPIMATTEGVAALGSSFEPLPTGAELLAYWLKELPEGERRILEIIANAYPKAVDRESISEATNYKRSSRDTYLQRLRSRQLIEQRECRMSETLA